MNEFIKQRSFELSYALFQLARLMKQDYLRGRIEANAVYLLESSEGVEAASLGRAIAVLKKLVILGEGIGEIGYSHSRLINKQFSNLNAAIAEYAAIKDSAELNNAAIDMDKIFSGSLLSGKPGAQKFTTPQIDDSSKKVNKKLYDVAIPRAAVNPINRNTSFRYDAVIEKIRQFGNESGCQLKDIIAAFPDVSERTLRYDLQRACEQGVMERVGNGGPTSYYRIKQSIQALVPTGVVTN